VRVPNVAALKLALGLELRVLALPEARAQMELVAP